MNEAGIPLSDRICHRAALAFLVVLAISTASAPAQEASSSAFQMNDLNSPSGTLVRTNHWRIGASLDYSYVAAGGVSFQGVTGNSDAQYFNASLNGEIPLNDKWFVPLGIGSRNLFLGTISGAPIPDQINTLNLNAGVGFCLDEQWTFIGSVGPQLYRLDGVDGDDVGIGGALRATWKWKPNLTLTFGVGFNPANDIPVLPVAGLRWDIRTNLTLNLILPRPALIYRVNKRLDLFAGASGNFAVFRADANLGDKIGQPAFNNALGTYRDFHIGAGMDFRLHRGISINVEGGYSLGREIDYSRINQTVSFNNAPYFQIAAKWRF